jgi:hypothetical protein
MREDFHHGGTEDTEKYTEEQPRTRSPEALLRVLLRAFRASVVKEPE